MKQAICLTVSRTGTRTAPKERREKMARARDAIAVGGFAIHGSRFVVVHATIP